MNCAQYNFAKINLHTSDLSRSSTKRKEFLRSCKGQRTTLLTDYVATKHEEEQVQGSEAMCNTSGSSPISYKRSSSQELSLNDYLDGRKIDKSKSSKNVEKKILPENCNRRQDLMNKQEHVFKVLANGTRLMKSMDFLTMIVQLRKGHMSKSTIYWVILQPEADKHKMKIACLVFSKPDGHSKTKVAELLPLYFLKCSNSATLSPMLRRKRFKRIFRRNSYFKIQWLLSAKVFDGPGGIPWRMYDIRNRPLRNLLKESIEQDMNKMVLLMSKIKSRLKISSNRNNVLQRDDTRALNSVYSLGCADSDEKEISDEIAGCKKPCIYENNQVSATVFGGDYIGSCSEALFPSMCKRKEVRRDRRTKESSKSYEELDRYWIISGIVI